jgi:hypothetical protein
MFRYGRPKPDSRVKYAPVTPPTVIAVTASRDRSHAFDWPLFPSGHAAFGSTACVAVADRRTGSRRTRPGYARVRRPRTTAAAIFLEPVRKTLSYAP